MKFFIDTADVAEIADLAGSGFVDGVTTNPSLIAKSGRNFLEVVREICEIVPGPVSAEVTSVHYDDMLAEGRKLAKLAANVCVKVPADLGRPEGLPGADRRRHAGQRHLVLLAGQALLAAKAGATFVSPFVGRLDDVGQDGMQLISDIVEIYRNYPTTLRTEVLVASVRGPNHVIEAARLGAHVVTLPPKVLRDLVLHPLTDKGLAAFVKDWAATGQRIL